MTYRRTMLRRLIFLSLLSVVLSINAFATAQYPDKIYYDGKEYMLHSNPMESYFEKHPEKKPSGGIMSSALWRGYVATFEIASGELRLRDIQIMVRKEGSESFETEWKSALGDVIPKGQMLKIDWFTGLLVLPYGKIVNYVHMGYGSTYESYILLEITAGAMGRSKQFSNSEYDKFRDRQFAAFKKTDEYRKVAEEMKKDSDNDEKFIDGFLRSFITSYTSKILVD